MSTLASPASANVMSFVISLILVLFIDQLPVKIKLPLRRWVSSVLSPNLVEPLSKIVVDWDTSVTNFSAVKIPPTVKLPVIL